MTYVLESHLTETAASAFASAQHGLPEPLGATIGAIEQNALR